MVWSNDSARGAVATARGFAPERAVEPNSVGNDEAGWSDQELVVGTPYRVVELQENGRTQFRRERRGKLERLSRVLRRRCRSRRSNSRGRSNPIPPGRLRQTLTSVPTLSGRP
jgi:hypothetical protein